MIKTNVRAAYEAANQSGLEYNHNLILYKGQFNEKIIDTVVMDSFAPSTDRPTGLNVSVILFSSGYPIGEPRVYTVDVMELIPLTNPVQLYAYIEGLLITQHPVDFSGATISNNLV
jgi:hypothetical protein